MNSEPPIGDDLQRMLVSMKQNVLERAVPRRRRARRTGVVVTVIALLALGTAGGGVALGLIPATPAQAPQPSPSTTSTPSPSVTPSSAPVVDDPTPVPTPTPTVPAYSAADWSTWTVTADAVGPATLGSPTGADDTALRAGFTPAPPLVDDTGAVLYPFGCPNQDARIWDGPGGARVVELTAGGAVGTVIVEQQGQDGAPDGQVGPRTAAGVGLGSTLAELRAAYPDLVQTRQDAAGGTSDTTWAVAVGERYVVFEVAPGNERVDRVSVSGTDEPVVDYCS